jgi:hypothetical protein
VCHPGFSTRETATDVSGRGVGLDAVRSSVYAVGGAFQATTRPGRGTTWRIAIPVPRITFDGLLLRFSAIPFPVVVQPGTNLERAAELVQRLGVGLALATDVQPSPVTARRLIATAPPAAYEVVAVDSGEALLVHPGRR